MEAKRYEMQEGMMDALRQQLLFGSGGTLIEGVSKGRLGESRLLVVGLGGLGTKAVSKLKTMVCRECTDENQDHVKYLAFDTADADLKELCQADHSRVALEYGKEAILLGNGVKGKASSLVSAAPSAIKEWVSPGLSLTFDADGAGGCRQGGRFLLSSANTAAIVKSAIDTALHALTAGVAAPNLTVVLLAGISGGTGAGTFIDVGYMIRSSLESQPALNNTKTSAYLFMPDVLDNKVPPLTDPYAKMLRRNAYACIKELDRFMHLEDDKLIETTTAISGNQAMYRIKYPGISGEIISGKNVFDYCTFVCGTTGAVVVGDPYEKALRTVASCILETLKANDNVGPGGEKRTLLSSVMCNEATTLTAMADSLVGAGIFPKDANYRYQAIGYGSVRLPVEECIAYTGDKLFRKMREKWDNMPNQQAVENLYRNANLVLTSLSNDAQTVANANGNSIIVHFDLNKERWIPYSDAPDKSLDQMETHFLGHVDAYFRRIGASWQHVLEGRCRKLDECTEEIFKNVNLGPYYLIRLLVGEMDGNDKPLLQYIGEAIARVRSMRAEKKATVIDSMDLGGDLKRAYDAFTEAGFLTKRSKYEHLMTLLSQYYYTVYEIRFYDKLIELYQGVQQHIMSENDKVWSVYTEAITACSSILAKDAEIATNPEIAATPGGASYSWSLIDLKDPKNVCTKRLIAELDRYLAEYNDPARMEAFLNNMIQNMLDKREEWTAIRDADHKTDGADKLARVLRGFFGTQLKELVTMNIDRFIQIAYVDPDAAKPLEQQRKDAAQIIYMQVKSQAEPTFNPTPNMELHNFPKMEYIAVPTVAQNLQTDIKALALDFKELFTSNSDKVVLYRLYYGLPAYCMNLIRDCEEKYYAMLKVDGAPGLQLSEGEYPLTKNWRSFDDPLHKDVWKQFDIYRNENKLKRQEWLTALVQKAMAYGIVTRRDPAAVPTGTSIFSMTIVGNMVTGLATKRCIGENGEPIPEKSYLSQLTGSFDRNAFTERFLAAHADEEISLDAKTYLTYAEAIAEANGTNVVTEPASKLYKFFRPETAEDFAAELRASLERQRYLDTAIKEYEPFAKAVEAHNAKVSAESGKRIERISFMDYWTRGIIRDDPDMMAWYFSDGQTANNELFAYARGLELWYKEYYAFEAYAALDPEKKAAMQQALDQAMLDRRDPEKGRELIAADRERTKRIKQQANALAFGTSRSEHQLSAIGLEGDFKLLGRTPEELRKLKEFYQSIDLML